MNIFSMKFPSANNILFFLPVLACSFFSCRQLDVFEKNTPIPHYRWKSNFSAEGSFIINDTLVPYNIYIVLRHTDAYMYNNIWVNVGLKAPGDTMYFQRLNLVLGHDATGWEGTGMNDIWEDRKLINRQPRRFIKKGEYKFSIKQAMRDDPLPGIMSAGLRVVKQQ